MVCFSPPSGITLVPPSLHADLILRWDCPWRSTAPALPLRAVVPSSLCQLCKAGCPPAQCTCSPVSARQGKTHLLPAACPANSMGRELLLCVLQRCTLISKQAGVSQLVVSAQEESHRLQQKQHGTDSAV